MVIFWILGVKNIDYGIIYKCIIIIKNINERERMCGLSYLGGPCHQDSVGSVGWSLWKRRKGEIFIKKVDYNEKFVQKSR